MSTRPSPSPPLRCLVVTPSLTRGGAERQAVLVALALRDHGMDVRLFAGSSPTSLVDDGLTGPLRVDLPGPSESLRTQLVRLHHALSRFEPDAVITFAGGATVRYALARATSAAARRAAWIVTARGNVQLRQLVEHPAISAVLLLHCHRQADRIVTNSSALAANLFATDVSLAHKAVVVPNILLPFASDAVEARRRVLALTGGTSRGPIVGCIGSFQIDRNYILMADSLRHVLRVRPEVHLLIIGRTEGAAYSRGADAFRSRVEALGLREHVTMVGEIANGRTLLAGLDVFALSSTLEGSSNALGEAMLAGVATVTVPVADAEELVGNAAVVSSGWTPTAFAQAILAALEDVGGLQQRAAARGRLLALERSSVRVGARWVEVVKEGVAMARSRGAQNRP